LSFDWNFRPLPHVDNVTMAGRLYSHRLSESDKTTKAEHPASIGSGPDTDAITASINVEYYTTSRHCFLKLAPFLGTVVVPAAVLLSLMLGFALSAYCVLSTAPSHVTEQIEVFTIFNQFSLLIQFCQVL